MVFHVQFLISDRFICLLNYGIRPETPAALLLARPHLRPQADDVDRSVTPPIGLANSHHHDEQKITALLLRGRECSNINILAVQ